ncbi:bone morphogenetic protein 15 [Lates japonicus]|uniref:Bone morphogenetic protein 15 n=1 Tax=Lates japonicus TaxID=270547 RepID=A0AAD3NM61_LATJO|nr:bone morphogenetic protein 15 [Lates japonicus]
MVASYSLVGRFALAQRFITNARPYCGSTSCPVLSYRCTPALHLVKMASHQAGEAFAARTTGRWPDGRGGPGCVQFMLQFVQEAAERTGGPNSTEKFGSNTVACYFGTLAWNGALPASVKDHHYTFTVQYNLDTLPSEQLIRVSFIHLRSSSIPSSSSTTPSTTQALEPPRCRAQITSLGPDSLVTLEPHEQWTETDITGHVLQGKDRGEGGHLTLTAQYWCKELGLAEEDSSLLWWWTRLWGRQREEPHLEVPSLLLYLEEEREVKDWMAELLGAEGENIMRRMGQWHPLVRRHRRSKDSSSSEPKDPLLDALKNVPTSSSSSSFSTSPSASIISDIPIYKRKTSAPKNRCKLHSFRLSFDELGWGHYFIAPPVYNPRFCQGDCPRVLHYGYHSPNHAIIQTVINDLGVGDVPPPSCVPYKYMPMSVLVVHKKKVEYRELEDMVAESCTCR